MSSHCEFWFNSNVICSQFVRAVTIRQLLLCFLFSRLSVVAYRLTMLWQWNSKFTSSKLFNGFFTQKASRSCHFITTDTNSFFTTFREMLYSGLTDLLTLCGSDGKKPSVQFAYGKFVKKSLRFFASNSNFVRALKIVAIR